jgi:hypothetical protein
VTTYDYTNQAWIVEGRYIRCGHPEDMECDCYGRIHAGESATPPIAAEADPEYRPRIQAAQVSWQFTDALRPRKAQASIEDLPLFGGERQEEMF